MKIMNAALITLAPALALFALLMLNTALGALTGLCVGFFFEDAILAVLSGAGLNTTGISLWMIGATLSFTASCLGLRQRGSANVVPAALKWAGKRKG